MHTHDLPPEACAEMIHAASCVVALTGAGVSTAAGIPDFRGPRGLYVTRQYDPDTIFNIEYFRRDPLPFYDFTRDFIDAIGAVRPTLTHRFLAHLERQSRLAAVITQNIDPLHEMAGSRQVVAVHGNYWSSHCQRCSRDYTYEALLEMIAARPVPHCGCGGVIKPDVVFFGEPVRDMDRAQELVQRADLLFVLGSSLVVYPAALLPELAHGRVVVVNQGDVSLAPGPDRFFVAADLDAYLGQVATALGLPLSADEPTDSSGKTP